MAASEPPSDEVRRLLIKRLKTPIEWNDAYDRTQAEVLALLDELIGAA